MKILTLWRNIRESFWYLPTLYSIAAFVLALLTMRFDFFITSNQGIIKFVPNLLLSDKALSQNLLISISAALLTMTTITFSSILVVLTTFLSNFSPRTLQNYITNHSTQRVLGCFVGSFVYSIIILLQISQTEIKKTFLSPSFAILVTFICLAFFVFFVHQTSKWIQVGYLIFNISSETKKLVEENSLNGKKNEFYSYEEKDLAFLEDQEPLKYSAQSSGYIEDIDEAALVEIAERYNCIIKIEKRHTDLVNNESNLFSIWNMTDKGIINEIYNCFSIGSNRAPYDNVEFGLRKLVEIALRAISPAVNDPNTAVHCIEQIGSILSLLGKKQLPNHIIFDESGNIRIITEPFLFSDYLYFCFYQIRHYGNEDISIIRAILKAFIFIAESNNSIIKQSVWEFSAYIMEGIQQKTLLSLDRRYLNDLLLVLAKICEREHEFIKGLDYEAAGDGKV